MQSRNGRSNRGSAMVEFGPALFVTLFLLFFPMVNLIALGVSYGASATLNDLQVREAALQPSNLVLNPGGAVQKSIPEQWMGSIGKLVTDKTPKTMVSYRVASPTDKTVTVSTKVVARPFLTIPFLSTIPGLGAPVDFTLTSERIVEILPAFASKA